MSLHGWNRVWVWSLLALASAVAAPTFAWHRPCGYDLGIEASAEFLLWNVCHSDDLLIGVTDSVNSSPSGGGVLAPHITAGHTHIFELFWKTGFRLNAAYHFPISDWVLGASYTYFHFSKRNTVTPSPGGILWASNFPVTAGLASAAADEATARLLVKYDLIDLFLAVTCTWNRFTGRYYGGLRSLIFNETYRVDYTFDESVLRIQRPGTARWSAYLPAFGFTGGYDGIYSLYNYCRGLGIRGRLGASLLGGRVRNRQHWTFQPPPQTVVIGAETYNNHYHGQLIWGWDAALGIDYDTCWCCIPFNLAFGYEIFDWWNTPRQHYFPNEDYPGVATTDETGRFTVHGFYVRLGTSF
jgi:hypothetical protein